MARPREETDLENQAKASGRDHEAQEATRLKTALRRPAGQEDNLEANNRVEQRKTGAEQESGAKREEPESSSRC